jgi:uncharacterized protein YfdQ (DUF2303 family)
MDKSAIEQIQQTQTVDILNSFLKTDGPSIVLPDNFSVVDLEQYAEQRNRFRGTMKTESVNDFITYLSEYDNSELASETYIDGDNMRATCLHNIGTTAAPGHCDHKSILGLQKTAAYNALLAIAGSRYDQKDLSDYLEDWASIIQCTNSEGENLSHAIAVNAVRGITIARARELSSNIGDFENSASAIEKVEAKNKNTLPAFITLTLKPYADLQERSITLRCSLLTSSDKPVFILRIIKQEELDEQLVNEFKTLIQTKVKPLNTSVFIGSFSG